jgi:uncharacterized protein YfkK (UPF0435 family)
MLTMIKSKEYTSQSKKQFSYIYYMVYIQYSLPKRTLVSHQIIAPLQYSQPDLDKLTKLAQQVKAMRDLNCPP